MATLSSAGIGSGLDVTTIVTQLMAIERQPITALEKKESSYKSQLSALGSIKSALATLQDAAAALATPAKFSAYKASVAENDQFTVSAGSSAVAGSYSVEVQALAVARQDSTGTAYASPSDVVAPSAGTLTVTIGGNAVDIAIDANASLSNVRDAINGAGAGISATIVTGTVGGVATSQLFITANTAGSAGDFTLSNADGNLATFLGNVSNTRAASDATVVVNGVTVTSSSNTVTNAIEGVTLNLTGAAVGTTRTVTVDKDAETIQANIEKFVTAYNDAMKALRDSTSYNATTKTGAVLMGDSLVRNIIGAVRSTVAQAVPGLNGALQTLADVGIKSKVDGSLEIDANKLKEALGDPAKDVGQLFVKSAGTTGVASALDTLIETYTGVDGLLAGRTGGIDSIIKDIGDRKQVLEDRLESIEKRYLAQYTALDKLIASMSTTSAYLTQQLSKLSSSS